MNNKISLTIAEKTVMQDAIIRNTKEVSYRIRKRKGKTEERKLQIVPKRHEIGIERKSLVYVPKWNITFRSGDFEYKRMALAASCIFVADEIALCDMHSSLALKYGIDIRGLSQYVKYVAEHFAMTIFLELIKCIIAKTIYLVTHKC